MILLFLLAALPAHAKRYVPPPPPAEAELSRAELKMLAERVAREIRACAGSATGPRVAIEVADKTSAHLDTNLVADIFQQKLADGGNSRELSVQGYLTVRIWPSGKNRATYTLRAVAKAAGKKICDKLHRTVIRR